MKNFAKQRRSKFYYSFFSVMLPIVFIAATFSCTTANIDKSNSIKGAWASTIASAPYDDWFDVSGDSPSEFIYYKNGDPTNDVGIRGEITKLVYTGKQSGYIIYKVTYSNLWADLTTDEYSVMRWQDNDTTSCKAASQPYKSGFPATKATAADAESEFTIANGYYAFLSNYNKK